MCSVKVRLNHVAIAGSWRTYPYINTMAVTAAVLVSGTF